MFKFNLTSWMLLLITVYFFVTTVKQCGMKNDYERVYQDRTAQYMIWENKISKENNQKLLVLRDSIEYFRKMVDLNLKKASKANKRVREIKREYKALEPKVREMPYDSSYAFLTGLYESTDTLEYPLSGNQVEEIHLDLLEGIKCSELNRELEFENYYLDESLMASGRMNYKMQEEIDMINENFEKMVEEFNKGLVDNKKLKKKVWVNRLIGIGASTVAVLVLL